MRPHTVAAPWPPFPAVRLLSPPALAPLALTLALLVAAGPAAAQAVTNQIRMVTPNTAAQGTAGLLVTFALDTDSPPAPPAGVLPTSVALGALAGASVTHATQYAVTAIFNVDADQAAGARDATIVFALPNGGTLTFSLAGAFTVTAVVDQPPSVTVPPAAATAYPGDRVSFSVTATGSAPLAYRWQKDEQDLDGATASTLEIDPVTDADAGSYRCVVGNGLGSATSAAATLTVNARPVDNFHVVDTGQVKCYNETAEIACPGDGAAWYGQDGQCDGRAPHYTLAADGLTVRDDVTDLTWQRSPDTNGDGQILAADKLTLAQALARPAALNAVAWGGFSDWRLPTIKELYSLIDFRGTDPSGLTGSDTSQLTPFIDNSVFRFAWGQTSAGERLIDSQYATRNTYVGPNWSTEGGKLFGVNFADGRIKGYGLVLGGADKTFFVQCVRGNPAYGVNNLVDNGDGTVTDRATYLTWSKTDSGAALTWTQALAWVQARNAEGYLGHDDWRLPDAKELQGIVDYSRAPDATTVSRQGPACDPVFTCTPITNEACQPDYPWYWTGTTHANYQGGGQTAAYVCFGRAMGYMAGQWVDVHGAGSQRSDPKSGGMTGYTQLGCGWYNAIAPQGDAVRPGNYVRLVRGGAGLAAVDDDADAPLTLLALGAAPNPTSRGTTISFDLRDPGRVRVGVYDLAGRLVAALLDEPRDAGVGSVAWDGRDRDGRAAAAGLYLATARTDHATKSVKVLLLR